MNELLQKLKEQKAKLPPEDHSIIDWGISLIRSQMLEDEQSKNKMSQQSEFLFRKYGKYQDFINEQKWIELDLDKEKDRQKLYESCKNCLIEILDLSCNTPGEGGRRLLKQVKYLKYYLFLFCSTRGAKRLPQQIVDDWLKNIQFIHDHVQSKYSQYPQIVTEYIQILITYLKEEVNISQKSSTSIVESKYKRNFLKGLFKPKE